MDLNLFARRGDDDLMSCAENGQRGEACDFILTAVGIVDTVSGIHRLHLCVSLVERVKCDVAKAVESLVVIIGYAAVIGLTVELIAGAADHRVRPLVIAEPDCICIAVGIFIQFDIIISLAVSPEPIVDLLTYRINI